MRQTPLKYEKELFDQVKKLKANFFGVPNTHISSMILVINKRIEEKRVLYLNMTVLLHDLLIFVYIT